MSEQEYAPKTELNPAFSDDTRLNLREKTINCTQYYKNQNEGHIRTQIRLTVTIYDENVSPREVDWSVIEVSPGDRLPCT